MCEMMTMTRNINIQSSSNQEMKDSGVDWIGLIPADWEVKPLKSVSKITMGQSPSSDEVTDTGTIPFLQGNAEFGDEHPAPIHYCDSASKRCSPGDILMSVRAPVGEINVADQQYAIGRGLCAITSNINNDFMRFALQKYSKDFLVYSNGSTFDAITMGSLNNFRIAVPPLNIQSDIASVLESECFKINTILKSVNHMIEDLIDLKQSIISEVVTKGLDDSVSMKDSGVSWIGQIPINWDVSKVGMVLTSIKDGTHSVYTRCDRGHPLLSAKNVFDDGIHIGDSESLISEEDYLEIVSSNYPKKGDVLFCSVGTIGRCCVYDFDEPLAFQRSVAFLRCNSRIIPEYLSYVLKSSFVQYNICCLINKSAQEGLYMNAIRQLYVTVPPLTVQKEIVDYLDSKMNNINCLTAELEGSISALTNLKSSICYEYVTGKRSVTGGGSDAAEISG